MTGVDADMYRRLVESSPEGVVLVNAQDPERPVVYVNPGFEALTGYSAAELLGRNLRLLQADDREQDGRHRQLPRHNRIHEDADPLSAASSALVMGLRKKLSAGIDCTLMP